MIIDSIPMYIPIYKSGLNNISRCAPIKNTVKNISFVF